MTTVTHRPTTPLASPSDAPGVVVGGPVRAGSADPAAAGSDGLWREMLARHLSTPVRPSEPRPAPPPLPGFEPGERAVDPVSRLDRDRPTPLRPERTRPDQVVGHRRDDADGVGRGDGAGTRAIGRADRRHEEPGRAMRPGDAPAREVVDRDPTAEPVTGDTSAAEHRSCVCGVSADEPSDTASDSDSTAEAVRTDIVVPSVTVALVDTTAPSASPTIVADLDATTAAPGTSPVGTLLTDAAVIDAVAAAIEASATATASGPAAHAAIPADATPADPTPAGEMPTELTSAASPAVDTADVVTGAVPGAPKPGPAVVGSAAAGTATRTNAAFAVDTSTAPDALDAVSAPAVTSTADAAGADSSADGAGGGSGGGASSFASTAGLAATGGPAVGRELAATAGSFAASLGDAIADAAPGLQQLVERSAVLRDAGELSLDLSSEGLGGLTLTATASGGQLHLLLTAADGSVAEMLRNAGGELRRELEGSGMPLGSFDVAHRDGSPSGDRSPRGEDSAAARRSTPVDGRPVEVAVRPSSRLAASPVGLDLRL
jgi:flagellar hook-length control protein FliK